MGYENEFVDYLDTLVNDVDRRIKRGQARLALSAQHQAVSWGWGDNFVCTWGLISYSYTIKLVLNAVSWGKVIMYVHIAS